MAGRVSARLRAVQRALAAATVEAAPAPAITDPEAPLSDDEIAGFMEEGYVALPGIIPDEHRLRLNADVDRLEADRGNKEGPSFIVEYEELGKLCSWPPIVDKVAQLMRAYPTGEGRDQFAMHHIHASRHDEGQPSVGWHQDYHCSPAVFDRDQLMVHVFFYFNGLNGTVGDLMAVPGSQKAVISGIPPSFNNPDDKPQWGYGGPQDLPGQRIFGEGNPLPPGSAVIVHSALMHARRAKPGFVNPRYFVDISYCQPGLNQWPSYGEDQHFRIFDAALAMGHDRDGKYKHIWDGAMFYTKETMDDRVRYYSELRQGRRLKSE